MSGQPGLRERKKRQSRALIAETARRLFMERGFEGVTVAEIAREADVAEKTVFNYFPTKEDLFYFRLEAFEEELLQTIRNRARGETVLEAFSRFLLAPRGALTRLEADESAAARKELRTITRVITESPALLARERQLFDRYTETLAALLAEESGAAADDIEPRVVASALLGVHRALIDFVRRRTLVEDDDPAQLARALRARGKRALQLLEAGFEGYARAPERAEP
jgi:AcrR family transcriptional regulator